MGGFVHLHCHSCWSLLDGALPAEALAHIAKELGFEAVALTDHDALTGAVRFSTACRDAGIKPIYGAELTIRRAAARTDALSEEARTNVAASSTPCRSDVQSRHERRQGGATPPPTEHVTVIAKNKTGYANLCRLLSDSHLSNERGEPATSFEAISERCDGLFVLSGCASGGVARLAAAGRIPEAIELAKRWRDAIGEDYRVEVFDHRGYGDRLLRDRLLRVAHEAGVRAVATNNVHYAVARHAITHEVLHALKEIVPLSQAHASRGTSEYYLKDAA